MPVPVDASGPDVLPHLSETDTATRRLLTTLAGLSDADLRAPTVLPGWTRGHVVAHLCRNADAVTNLVEWAATGEERPMYTSQSARDAAIDAGAGRHAAEQLADARESAGRFLRSARALAPERWDAAVARLPAGEPFSVRRVGEMRRTEVEVHHADLGVGYTAADWPPDFVEHLLARRRRDLHEAGIALVLELTDRGEQVVTGGGAGPRVSGAVADVLWWLLGRGRGERLACSEPRLPDLGRWA